MKLTEKSWITFTFLVNETPRFHKLFNSVINGLSSKCTVLLCTYNKVHVECDEFQCSYFKVTSLTSTNIFYVYSLEQNAGL